MPREAAPYRCSRRAAFRPQRNNSARSSFFTKDRRSRSLRMLTRHHAQVSNPGRARPFFRLSPAKRLLMNARAEPSAGVKPKRRALLFFPNRWSSRTTFRYQTDPNARSFYPLSLSLLNNRSQLHPQNSTSPRWVWIWDSPQCELNFFDRWRKTKVFEE